MKKRKLLFRILIALLFCALAVYSITVYTSRRARKNFPVRGVDVSSYQGYIDWEELEEREISFAFIKATEGSSYRDRCFEDNINNIQGTDIAVGAYHFMSFESDGKAQAENFITAVSPEKINLPPVIDLELYGDYNEKPPSAEHVGKILDDMINALYDTYGEMPIIYTNRRAYSLYVSGKYEKCDIWICDVIKKPALPDGRNWTFWQYTHTGKLPGYDGEEEHIDLNVFCGSEKEFKEYVKNGHY